MWHITFYKKVSDFRGRTHMEKVEFDFKGSWQEAAEEAVRRGHNPNKNIMWKWVEI